MLPSVLLTPIITLLDRLIWRDDGFGARTDLVELCERDIRYLAQVISIPRRAIDPYLRGVQARDAIRTLKVGATRDYEFLRGDNQKLGVC
jgi:hypothetical protein